MKAGQASQTAVMVCMGRALAHGRTTVSDFSDPTALTLLPDEARVRVERIRSGERGSMVDSIRNAIIAKRSQMMIARTVAIDRAVRSATAPQVVILGAGLDGRAWRMSELKDTVVFEVDHPDSQRDKRARAARLNPECQAVRFVPVDFARDNLDQALAAAGHDPTAPTTWVWEGVVMYLTLDQIEATLKIVGRRSAPGSRLIIAYFQPALILKLIGWLLARVGEPLRSTQTPEEMRAILRSHDFTVQQDEDLGLIAGRLSSELAAATKQSRHMRIVTADKSVANANSATAVLADR
ncbi:MAG: class I SAM-dependent methyltransferase [Polyangiaceae bacterium]